MIQSETTTRVLTISSEAEYRRFYELWQQSRHPVILLFTFYSADPFHVANLKYCVESTAQRIPILGEEQRHASSAN